MKPKYAYSVCNALGGVFFLLYALFPLVSSVLDYFTTDRLIGTRFTTYFLTDILPNLMNLGCLLHLLLGIAMLANWRSPVATTGFGLYGIAAFAFVTSRISIPYLLQDSTTLILEIRKFVDAVLMLLVALMGFACLTRKVSSFRMAMRKIWFLPAVFAFLDCILNVVSTYLIFASTTGMQIDLLSGVLLTAAWAMAGCWFAALPMRPPVQPNYSSLQ